MKIEILVRDRHKVIDGKDMYCIYNKERCLFLNYARKVKKMFSSGYAYDTVHSPYPTLRPKSHIRKHFVKWVANTKNPSDYVIIKYTGKELK